jgi:hypothetical protein
MSKVTAGQLKVFFILNAAGKISAQAFAEFLKSVEKGKALGLSEFFESALAAARDSAKKNNSGLLWAEIARASAQISDLDRAKEIVPKIFQWETSFEAGNILIVIVRAYIDIKKFDDARKTALQIGNSYYNSYYQFSADLEIAKATNIDEDWHTVRQAWLKIKEPDMSCRALIDLASVTHDSGDIEAARKAINVLPEPKKDEAKPYLQDKCWLFINFAEVTNRAEDFQMARDNISRIKNLYWRKRYLADLAIATRNENDIEAARQVDLIKMDPYSQIDSLTKIAQASGASEDFKLVYEVADRIEIECQKDGAWLKIIWALLERDQIDKACQLRKRMRDWSQASRSIVEVLIEKKDWSRAYKIACSITDPSSRGFAFAFLAQGLAKEIRL